MLCIDDESMPRKVNVCGPNPASNAQVSAAIAKALGRPNWLTVPSFGLKALFGEGAETILTGQYAVPGELSRRQLHFAHPSLSDALRSLA
jgi:NAD dependent epimerase/dehydratase family enzyme